MTAKRILVVDDNPLSRKLLTDMLGAEGYAVTSVATGRDALDTIPQERPDVVLLDIMMPGMDGFEVVRRLKADKATRTTRIVMVTALDDDGSRTRLAAAGVNVMLTKPVDRWQLRSLLGHMFAEADGGGT